MKLRIGIAGELPADQRIFGKIDLLMEQIVSHLRRNPSDMELQIMVCPSYTGESWLAWNEAHQYPLCAYTIPNNLGHTEQYAQVIRKDTPLRSLLGEAMCNRADIFVIVWNEDVTESSGATWELMRIAYDKKVPCIWISSKSQQIYCLWESYYKVYTPAYLETVCIPMPDGMLQPLTAEEKTGRIFSFWERRRTGYLKKYNANQAVHPSEKDSLMKDSFQLEAEAAAGETIRHILLDKFMVFDGAAITLNSRFQTMLYQRSVLPLLATLFLAVGFYTEPLLGKILSGILPDMSRPIAITASLAASIGFLVYGILNLYVYRLSKSKHIGRWRKGFVFDRYIAELLRVLIHFAPYGVELDLRKLCADNQDIYKNIQHLTDDAEPQEQILDHKTTHHVLRHVTEMLQDQITYHEASIHRYDNIVHSLEKWGKVIFYMGFAVAIGHRGLQFVLTLFPISIWNEMDKIGIIQSFINMLALLLPAWAGYFSTKVQQNNFRFNLNNHRHMLSKLRAIKERVENALKQEDIPLEVLNIMIGELAELMLLEDTIGWQQQYMESTLKPL